MNLKRGHWKFSQRSKKRVKKLHGHHQVDQHMCYGVQEGEERRKEIESLFREIMIKNFQNLGKDPGGLKDFK